MGVYSAVIIRRRPREILLNFSNNSGFYIASIVTAIALPQNTRNQSIHGIPALAFAATTGYWLLRLA